MRVDAAGQHNHACRVNHFRVRAGKAGFHTRDCLAFNQNIRFQVFSALTIVPFLMSFRIFAPVW
jgi:hypothetical protein